MANGTLVLTAVIENTSIDFITPFGSRVVDVPMNLVKRMKICE